MKRPPGFPRYAGRLDWAGAPRAGWLPRIRCTAVAVPAMRVQLDNG
jgi:hypothetical protein